MLIETVVKKGAFYSFVFWFLISLKETRGKKGEVFVCGMVGIDQSKGDIG